MLMILKQIKEKQIKITWNKKLIATYISCFIPDK